MNSDPDALGMARAPVRAAVCTAVVLVLMVVAGWRILGELAAPASPIEVAQRQLAKGNADAARATALRVLAHEPLQPRAYVLLALTGSSTQQAARYEVAARRMPQNPEVQAWLAQHYLQRHDYPQALTHIDRLLREHPNRMPAIAPILSVLARDPAFAMALTDVLHQQPSWRKPLLSLLQRPRASDELGASQVLQAMQSRGDLDADEWSQWLNGLMNQGRWGEAFARWAATVSIRDGQLPQFYNGNFAKPLTDAGFDWHQRQIPGVLLDFSVMQASGEHAAHFTFMNRAVGTSGLEHPMLLLPGIYRLSMRMRAHGLKSALGLRWMVDCAAGRRVVVDADALDGSFTWRTYTGTFEVPAKNCYGQWLRLVNPVPGGAAQTVSGELWVAGITIEPTAY